TAASLALMRVSVAINSMSGPRRQMPQLLGIAHDVHRSNDVACNLERRRLHRSLGCLHNDTGQTVDDRKARREVVAPPLTFVRAGSVTHELRHTIGALDREHGDMKRARFSDGLYVQGLWPAETDWEGDGRRNLARRIGRHQHADGPRWEFRKDVLVLANVLAR